MIDSIVLPITEEQIDLEGIDLMFEVTRFCNMLCPHCIRGDRQKLKIKKEFINAMLEQINYIGTIMFTGGEPGLASDLIKYTLEACQHYNIEVQNFWLATNGSIQKPSFFNIIKDWINYCSDNEITGLRVSIDNYHDKISKWAFEELSEEIKSYITDNFYLDLSGAPNNSENLISEGRAKDNYYCDREIKHDIHLQNDGRIEGSLYINAKGYIITTCDISYKTMDNNQDFIICHVTDNIKVKLAEWFNNHPEQIYKD